MWRLCKPIKPGIVPPELIAPPKCKAGEVVRGGHCVKTKPVHPVLKPRPVVPPETMRPGSSFGGAHKKPDRLIKVPIKLPPKLELIKKPYC